MSAYTKCWCIIISILAIITTVIVVCVYYTNPSNPSFTVNDFYVSALNLSDVSALNLSDVSSTTTAENQTLFFDMKLHNKNKAMGAYYDPIQVTFSYIPNIKLTFVVAEFTIPKFYQDNKKSKNVRQTVTTRGIAPFNRTVTSSVFKVEVFTKVGFTSPAYRKKGRVDVVANVRVGQNGERDTKKGIKLFDSGGSHGFGGLRMQVVFIILSTATIWVIN